MAKRKMAGLIDRDGSFQWNVDIFKLNCKKILITVILWFVFVILHNLISALFGIEEFLFFILAVIVIPIYFVVSLVYTVYKMCFRKLYLKG